MLLLLYYSTEANVVLLTLLHVIDNLKLLCRCILHANANIDLLLLLYLLLLHLLEIVFAIF